MGFMRRVRSTRGRRIRRLVLLWAATAGATIGLVVGLLYFLDLLFH